MLIAIWLTLFALAAFLIFLGYQYQAELTLVVGYTFLFLMGVSLIWGGIDYTSGATSLSNYTYDVLNITLETVVETVSDTYTNYSNTTMGLVLSIIGGLGFANVLYNSEKWGSDD